MVTLHCYKIFFETTLFFQNFENPTPCPQLRKKGCILYILLLCQLLTLRNYMSYCFFSLSTNCRYPVDIFFSSYFFVAFYCQYLFLCSNNHSCCFLFQTTSFQPFLRLFNFNFSCCKIPTMECFALKHFVFQVGSPSFLYLG